MLRLSPCDMDMYTLLEKEIGVKVVFFSTKVVHMYHIGWFSFIHLLNTEFFFIYVQSNSGHNILHDSQVQLVYIA